MTYTQYVLLLSVALHASNLASMQQAPATTSPVLALASLALKDKLSPRTQQFLSTNANILGTYELQDYAVWSRHMRQAQQANDLQQRFSFLRLQAMAARAEAPDASAAQEKNE